eukprot:COSAG03_NODE_2811_length_2437_cov_31.383661_3_plen_67_part_00
MVQSERRLSKLGFHLHPFAFPALHVPCSDTHTGRKRGSERQRENMCEAETETKKETETEVNTSLYL